MIRCGHTAVQYLGLPMAVYMKVRANQVRTFNVGCGRTKSNDGPPMAVI